ncbi:hypothetical protein OIB37_18350 [Streptomyces sp. NBC_00820]|uniref:hypothetical protein n=1 Tax=Streptomyces sp. NBC_00820 TaxID=2975842 RepID=UPI002ED51258|nr:hypothetical protein OIB37_18350 [Streptomyces sp. NBC_00820]
MVFLAEATGVQILARAVGVGMSAVGALCLFLALLLPKAIDEERSEGNLEAASRIKRNALIILGLGVLLLGGGAALCFGS